jgi:hypothetical protein
MAQDIVKAPRYVIRAVAYQPQLGAGLHNAMQFGNDVGRHKPPLLMATLRPRIGEKDEDPADAFAFELLKQKPGIRIKDPNIAQAAIGDGEQQFGYAVDERLGSDESHAGIEGGKRRQMLAAAETDFQPDLADRLREKRKGRQPARGRQGYAQARQQLIYKMALAGAKGFGFPATVKLKTPLRHTPISGQAVYRPPNLFSPS